MHVVVNKLKKILKKKQINFKTLLQKAHVSKTALYHLIKKDSVLPASLNRLAKVLNVQAGAFLEEQNPQEKKIRKLIQTLEGFLKKYPGVNRENAWHTLLLLDEKPIERLKRGLLRGQHQKLSLH